MSMIDTHEQEQLDALKAWWKENSKWLLSTLAVIAVALALFFYWKGYQDKRAADASTIYAEVLKRVASNDAKRINEAVQDLVEKFGNTAYAPRAQLLAVQANLQVKDLSLAKTQLEWVISHANERGLQDTARLKLTSILLDEKKYDEAVKLLDATHPDSFIGLYADLKGDVLLAQGKTDAARVAYQQAFDKMDSKSAYRSLIQLKLDGLGGAK
jgi:predicted negative regulator of RcsB-dependent stress response